MTRKLLKPRQPAGRKRVVVTVTLPMEAAELVDATADQRDMTRSAVVEELILTHLRTPEVKSESKPTSRLVPPDPPPRYDEMFFETQEQLAQVDAAEPEAPQPKNNIPSNLRTNILPSSPLFEAFSKAVTDAGKEVPELRLADIAALEEIFVNANAANPSNPMSPFKLWVAHYARDTDIPTPSGLLMGLHRYLMMR